jgi:hypothetical protein
MATSPSQLKAYSRTPTHSTRHLSTVRRSKRVRQEKGDLLNPRSVDPTDIFGPFRKRGVVEDVDEGSSRLSNWTTYFEIPSFASAPDVSDEQNSN